jgi:DNA-binding MarR family transcriptional regulator
VSTGAPDRLGEQELRAWRGLLKVHAAVTRELDAELLAEHGLSVSTYEVLMFVADAEDERMRMADLADHVLLSRSGMTRLVDRLVRDGLVERCAAEDDARGAYAKLTPAGRTKLDAARRTHLDGVRRIFLRNLRADEQRELGDLWERILG